MENVDYSTAFYYYFSTTSQVLAAFLALSAVYVINHIQSLTNHQSYVLRDLINTFEIPHEISRLNETLRRKYNEIRAGAGFLRIETTINQLNDVKLTDITEPNSIDEAFCLTVNAARSTMIADNQTKKDLIQSTIRSIICGCLTIISSLILILVSPKFNTYIGYIFAVLILGGTLYTLFILSNSIIRTLSK